MTLNNIEQPSVGIVGAGWVGLPLAKYLQGKGVHVLTSGQSSESVQALTNNNVSAIKLVVQADALVPNNSAIFQQQCLIICIPPGIRYGKTDYPQKIKQIVAAASKTESRVENLILLSSTAVYNGLEGEVNEFSELNYSADKVAVIAQAEQYIINSNITHKCVLRLAGLIGYDRQPGRFFKNGRRIPNPDSVVNFIHRDDVIGILTNLMAVMPNWQDNQARVINGVIDQHPLRKDFYTKAVQKSLSEKPEFQLQQEVNGKQVNSVNIGSMSYEFTHPDLMKYLDNSNES